MITIPLLAIRTQKVGGIESAFYNLAKSLHADQRRIKLGVSKLSYLSPDFLNWMIGAEIHLERSLSFGQQVAFRFLEEIVFAAQTKSEKILWPNYHIPFSAKKSSFHAVLCNDFQYKRYPHYFSDLKKQWLDFHYRNLFSQADHVFFMSEFDRREAMEFFGESWIGRSSIANLPVDLSRYRQAAEINSFIKKFSFPFFLSVAHQLPHKRIDFLIDAFSVFAESDKAYRLVLVGTKSQAIEEKILSLPSELQARIEVTGFVTDAELGALYQECSAFVLPSVYEGFGLPQVEALMHGKIGVYTDTAAVPEITRGNGYYLPLAADSSDWADVLLSVASGGLLPKHGACQDLTNEYSLEKIGRNIAMGMNEV